MHKVNTLLQLFAFQKDEDKKSSKVQKTGNCWNSKRHVSLVTMRPNIVTLHSLQPCKCGQGGRPESNYSNF